jgi:hypothetical protein
MSVAPQQAPERIYSVAVRQAVNGGLMTQPLTYVAAESI